LIEVLLTIAAIVALYWAIKLILTVVIVMTYKLTGRMEELEIALALREVMGAEKYRNILKKINK